MIVKDEQKDVFLEVICGTLFISMHMAEKYVLLFRDANKNMPERVTFLLFERVSNMASFWVT
jgi:hypothetical protein